MKNIFNMLLLLTSVITLSSCEVVYYEKSSPTFEEKCVTLDDGYTYYFDDKQGLCILEVPNEEIFTIPYEINGIVVSKIGVKKINTPKVNSFFSPMISETIKTLIIENNVELLSYNLPNLETIIYSGDISIISYIVDDVYLVNNVPYYNSYYNQERYASDNFKSIQLVSNKKDDYELYDNIKIYLSGCVSNIDKEFFSNVSNSKIYVYFNEKPDGWEDGWNGNNEVFWGIKDNRQIL